MPINQLVPAGRSKYVTGGVIGVLAGIAWVLGSGTASAHTPAPIPPKSTHIVTVSKSSFTVRVNGKARHYRLYAATTKRQLAVAHISHAKKSRLHNSPTLTLKGLRYSTTPYFYRVLAINGPRQRWSTTFGTVGLQPATPTNLQATSSLSGTSLNWNSGPTTGFSITEATDPAMTQNVQTFTTEHQDHQFTPPNLEPDTNYYFQVSALNGTTASPVTPVVSTLVQADAQPVRVMTYNIKEADLAGEKEGGNTVAPWSQRRMRIAAMINGASPDVVAIQEGAALVGTDRREVDDLVSALGGTYALAQTELPPALPGNTRSGVYILYKPSVYTTVGAGGHWALGDSRWAAYQVLKNKTTGAEFLFVSPHLMVGQSADQKREDEDQRMVSQASAYARSMGGVPVIYAGDFNSDPSRGHAFNAPSDYNLSIGLSDAFDMAQSHTNAQYNSANGYQTRPPADGQRIDYVFTTPGIAVKSWALLLDLSHGKFVGGVPPSDHNPTVVNLLVPFQRVS